jgi:hypothetical protein
MTAIVSVFGKVAVAYRCTACGHEDIAHLGRLQGQAWLVSLGSMLGLILVTWLFMGADADENTFLALVVVGGIMVATCSLPIYLVLRARWWAGAEQKVAFQSRMEQQGEA